MLVLSRKKNERIRINDDITIAIVDICGDKVKVGIEAPKDVSVHREEVYHAIEKEKEGWLATTKPATFEEAASKTEEESRPKRPSHDDFVDAGLA